MITVQEAITRFRRDATVGTVVKTSLIVAALLILALHFMPLGKAIDPTLLMMLLMVVCFTLWYRTIKGSRLAQESSSLIASGNLEQAERQIEQSLRAFSMSPSIKSMSLLNLALVRLAQKRWPDAALLCREVLSVRKGTPDHLSKSSRLLLADSLLEMDDTRGAYEALSGLYQHRLSLGEALNLLRVQTEYLTRIGAWEQALQGIRTKVQLAELMPAPQAARTQALLALAAKRAGRADWANWLKRRVELLTDVRELAAQRPILWELWQA
jgi:hypothetical protein